jgi:hypothetical protein
VGTVCWKESESASQRVRAGIAESWHCTVYIVIQYSIPGGENNMPDPIFARVELHERPSAKPDYEVLKANMARQGFSHELLDGLTFRLLPTGEYVSIRQIALDEATRRVQEAADATGFANCGLITSTQGHRHFGLRSRPALHPAGPAPRLHPAGPAPSALSGALLEAMRRSQR